jgi:outer membrane protein OmpA-like peptidoglycan-associated protein
MESGEARHMPLAHAMLIPQSMMTRLGIVFCSLVFSSAAFAGGAATTGPDFVNAAPKRHIDRSLVASPDGYKRIDPGNVVPFLFDKAVLTAEGYDEVDTAARWLKSHPRHKLVLEGHTDAIGLAPYNEDLATRRMEAIRQRLRQHGIANDRIVLITFGEREAMDLENPLFPADRKVTMYATELTPQAVVAVVRENRPAIVASWWERGALLQMQHGLTTPTKTITVRR